MNVFYIIWSDYTFMSDSVIMSNRNIEHDYDLWEQILRSSSLSLAEPLRLNLKKCPSGVLQNSSRNDDK